MRQLHAAMDQAHDCCHHLLQGKTERFAQELKQLDEQIASAEAQRMHADSHGNPKELVELRREGNVLQEEVTR